MMRRAAIRRPTKVKSQTLKSTEIIGKKTKPIKKEAVPTFYRTKEYTEQRHQITSVAFHAFEKNPLTKQPAIKNIEKGLMQLKKSHIEIKNSHLSKNAKENLLDFCNVWIKNCENYIKRNKGVK